MKNFEYRTDSFKDLVQTLIKEFWYYLPKGNTRRSLKGMSKSNDFDSWMALFNYFKNHYGMEQIPSGTCYEGCCLYFTYKIKATDIRREQALQILENDGYDPLIY